MVIQNSGFEDRRFFLNYYWKVYTPFEKRLKRWFFPVYYGKA
jgi:hypothetical protein